jgi:hypothetical protein
MAAFFGTVAVIIVIMLIYFTCWSIGKRRRDHDDEVRDAEFKNMSPQFPRRYDNDVREFSPLKHAIFRPIFPTKKK